MRSDTKRASTVNHLEEFFANHPDFKYQPAHAATDEFYRMCRVLRVDGRSFDETRVLVEFRDALVQEFNRIYGTDEKDLGLWQRLCDTLRIYVPDTLDACRKVCCRSFLSHKNSLIYKSKGGLDNALEPS